VAVSLAAVTLLVHSKALADEDHSLHSMKGLYGSYPFGREASGTSWQPDLTPHSGFHLKLRDWALMFHGFATGIYDRQGGSRGDDEAFSTSMFMGMAQHPLGIGKVGLRTMLSLDPTMDQTVIRFSYKPVKTADGINHLIDRQHPHDLFMELAVSYSVPIEDSQSLYLYFGLPGEPALGPPAFMHRYSSFSNVEAPLSHHWLDSTHITYGVATLDMS